MRGLLLLLVPLSGCRCEEEPPPEPEMPRPDPVEWYETTVGGFRLSLPESFSDRRDYGEQTLFLGPMDQGFQTTVLAYWVESGRSLEDWAEFNRLKYEGGRDVVHEKRWTTLGGRRAYSILREIEQAVPRLGNRRMPFFILDWYVVHDGRAGYLRGIAHKSSFAFRWRPVFEEIARRVRYVK